MVTRGSSDCVRTGPCTPRLSDMVRNLKIRNSIPSLPGLRCRKKTGPLEVSFTPIATIIIGTEERSKRMLAAMKSRQCFSEELLQLLCRAPRLGLDADSLIGGVINTVLKPTDVL